MAPPFVRANVREMQGYTPGEQPALGERVVKLNTNENPFEPSPRVMKAIQQVEPEMLRRYPSPRADRFRHAAAKVLGISPEMILAGNGSDDILTIATRTFVAPGGVLAAPDPTYSLYPVLARLEQATFAPVPWDKDWSLPTEALLDSRADAIYLANPNAPSGTFVSPTKVAELARQFPGVLLIDEAYADFADDNCLALVRDYANVVIVRTMSKAYSLAGLRFGYAVGKWDGDTFVVNVTGFNDKGWLDDGGHPRSEAMRVTERWRRRDFGHMDIEFTFEDSKMYTKPWTVTIPFVLLPDTDIIENVCENEKDVEHVFFGGTKPK